MDDELAQVHVSPLADPEQSRFAARGVLPGYQAEPGGQKTYRGRGHVPRKGSAAEGVTPRKGSGLEKKPDYRLQSAA